MLVWVGILYLALSLPVTVSLSVSISERQSAVGASLFSLGLGARFDALAARSGRGLRLSSRYGPKRPARRTLNGRALRALSPILRAAAAEIQVRQFDLIMRVGLGDAGKTALTAGALRSVIPALLARAPLAERCALSVQPDFRNVGFLMTGHCIFRMMPGDIIFAALKAAIKMTRKEGFGWIGSIPLRA